MRSPSLSLELSLCTHSFASKSRIHCQIQMKDFRLLKLLAWSVSNSLEHIKSWQLVSTWIKANSRVFNTHIYAHTNEWNEFKTKGSFQRHPLSLSLTFAYIHIDSSFIIDTHTHTPKYSHCKILFLQQTKDTSSKIKLSKRTNILLFKKKLLNNNKQQTLEFSYFIYLSLCQIMNLHYSKKFFLQNDVILIQKIKF